MTRWAAFALRQRRHEVDVSTLLLRNPPRRSVAWHRVARRIVAGALALLFAMALSLLLIARLLLAPQAGEWHTSWRIGPARLELGVPNVLRLARIHTVAPTRAQLAADPAGARQLLAEACRDAARRFGAQAVVLGSAGLAGMTADIAIQVPVPLIGSVTAGAEWAVDALRATTNPPRILAGLVWRSTTFRRSWPHSRERLTR